MQLAVPLHGHAFRPEFNYEPTAVARYPRVLPNLSTLADYMCLSADDCNVEMALYLSVQASAWRTHCGVRDPKATESSLWSVAVVP